MLAGLLSLAGDALMATAGEAAGNFIADQLPKMVSGKYEAGTGVVAERPDPPIRNKVTHDGSEQLYASDTHRMPSYEGPSSFTKVENNGPGMLGGSRYIRDYAPPEIRHSGKFVDQKIVDELGKIKKPKKDRKKNGKYRRITAEELLLLEKLRDQAGAGVGSSTPLI